jgi:hypothetical protein
MLGTRTVTSRSWTRGNYAKLDYLNLDTALAEGWVLVYELRGRSVIDRRLIHRDYVDEFKYVEEGEQIVVRRATTNAARTRQST